MGDAMRTEFHQELDELEASLQEEGSLVVRAIRGAASALEHQDVELCDEVIAFDDEIDQRYHELERKIELILARQTPVASELRLVLAILHVNINLERMGDQAVNIANNSERYLKGVPLGRAMDELAAMSAETRVMVREALDSFVKIDGVLAQGVLERDDKVACGRGIVAHKFEARGLGHRIAGQAHGLAVEGPVALGRLGNGAVIELVAEVAVLLQLEPAAHFHLMDFICASHAR